MTKDYYVVLHHAKKNVGDFLIKDRALGLLRHLRADRDLVELPSWESLEPHIDLVNNSKALILMGGPGVGEVMYPKIYPLVRDLNTITAPIVLMGSGSYMRVFSSFASKSFKFSKDSHLPQICFLDSSALILWGRSQSCFKGTIYTVPLTVVTQQINLPPRNTKETSLL